MPPLARGNWTKLPSQKTSQKPSKAKKERRRARQFRREEFPMKGLQISPRELDQIAFFCDRSGRETPGEAARRKQKIESYKGWV